MVKRIESQENFERLRLSFHQTFIPERRYISNLLRFVAEPKEVNLEEVANATGIPTGESSGKVEPTLYYAKGMGLLTLSRGEGRRWAVCISPFGSSVLEEDPFMSEGLTQWLLHLQLCRKRGGAEAWFAVFAEGDLALGKSFTDEELKAYLVARYGKRSNIVGPLVKMYTSETSFLACGALTAEDGLIRRLPAPCNTTHFPGYGYLFFSLWDTVFPGVQQVCLEDFERKASFFAASGWDLSQVNRFVDHLADEQLLKIDRQTGNALLLRTCSAERLLKDIYINLL